MTYLNPQPVSASLVRRRAFSLTELMIAIALALLLIVGVNQIFKTTAETVGAGQTLSTMGRDSRAAEGMLRSDFAAAVTADAPCMILRSGVTQAFANQKDQLADPDAIPGTADDLPGNALGAPGNNLYVAFPNRRNHRTDTFSFFARDLFRRQTATDGAFVSPTATDEAWIWYGHLWQPDNTTGGSPLYMPTYNVNTYPGAGTASNNPNNYFASQWILGRMAMVLQTPPAIVTDPFIAWTNYPSPKPTPPDLSPLSCLSTSNDARWRVYESRYDLAGTNMDQFRADVNQRMAADQYWWALLTYNSVLSATPWPAYRFRCAPFFVKPLDSAKVAQTVPALLSHCSQFIVEYAGDFLHQDSDPTNTTTYGRVLDANPDGETDFVVDTSVNPAVKRIRWYGLPRDLTGTGLIPRTSTSNGRDLVNVLPLNDLRVAAVTQPPAKAPPFPYRASFEQEVPTAVNYSTAINTTTQAEVPNHVYTCAWSPSDPKPQMIRIIITLDDPTGRLADGQTVEYVFTLP